MNFLGNKRTNLDVIVHYLKHEEQGTLTTKQRDILDKMKEADRLLIQYKSGPDVILMMQAKYPGMSHTTAWRMIQYAEYAYGPLRRTEKDYARRLLIDDVWKEIEVCKGNRPKYHRTIAQLYKVLLEAYGFKQDDAGIDPETLEMHQNVAVFILDKKTFTLDIDRLDKMPMEERIKLQEELKAQHDYANYEEVSE